MTTRMTMRASSTGPLRAVSAALAAAGVLTVAGVVRAQEAPTGIAPGLPQRMTLRHGTIEGGKPEISVDGKAMTIRQTTPVLKLDWQRFDIGQGHAVKFEQPGQDAFVVNRVIGETTSRIDGALTANGIVYVVNPKGVLFGKEARVEVGGLIARARALPDGEMTGELMPLPFELEEATSDIENAGRIVVRDGGVAQMEGVAVRLLAGSRIEANRGRVELRGARAVEMENGSALQAFGGVVLFQGAEQIKLGNVIAHDLTLFVRARGEYHAKDKTYDGTSEGEVEPGGRIVGVDFAADSSLSMSYRFESPEPGLWQLLPDIQFRKGAGRVRTRGGLVFPENVVATIKPLSLSERRRIDLPVIEKATVGEVAIGDPVEKTLTIRQTTPYALLDWKSFNVAEEHRVRFEQPDAQALVVNRVAGEASRIHGRIESNGGVFLINPQGITFGRTAQVSVGSLLAAGMAPVDAVARKPLAAGGSWTFGSFESNRVEGDVINWGVLEASRGDATGTISLLSPKRVMQHGRIFAKDVDLTRAQVALVGRDGRAINPGTTRQSTAMPGVTHTGSTTASRGVRIWEGMSGHVTLSGEIDAERGGLGVGIMAPMGADLNARITAPSVKLEEPLTLKFTALDKFHDGTTTAQVRDEIIGGLNLGLDTNLRLLKRYDFDSPEPGSGRQVSAELALAGFHGDSEAKLPVRIDPASTVTASIRNSPFPVLEKRVVGGGEEGTSGKRMTIKQTDPYLLLDWRSFNLAQDHELVFEQQKADWLVVNRVTGSGASSIDGRIEAMGSVFLLNPNGIAFGKDAKVEVGGLVAAALSSTDDAWSVRPFSPALQGSGAASVSNQGEITIAREGVATLAAPGEVVQAGRITAPEGAIHLASAERVTLDRAGRIRTVDGARQRIGHTGTSSAEDGDITMFGGEFGEVAGVVRATGKGRIRLDGTWAGWHLSGDMRPGAGLLLSEVISRVQSSETLGSGTLASAHVEQWLNAGADVEVRRGQALYVQGPSLLARADASGVLALTSGRVVFEGTFRVPRLRLAVPLTVSFDAKDKPFDGNANARVDNADFKGVDLGEDSNLRFRPRYRFASAEPGRHLVSAEVDLVGFNGDEALPLTVAYDGSAQDLARRTASILPVIKPIEPEIRPTVPEVKPTLPEVTPTVPETKPTVPETKPTVPEIKPSPPTSPARAKRSLALRRAVACEARRDVVRALDCDAAVPAPIAPAATSAPVLVDRGIRAPR